METHVPREGIHSFRQFIVEVAMIVLGVLIALAVEQVRERHHERKVAQEAREGFRSEMELERKALNFYFDRVKSPRESLEKFLAAEKAEKKGGATMATYEAPIWQFLPSGAWDAAVGTQAFSYMEPAEVQNYSLVHTGQLMFNRFAEQMQPVLADLDTFRGRTDLTTEEQRQRDHDIRTVLEYLNSIDQAGHALLHYFDLATTGGAPTSQ